jgi:16S rRNA G966 N2-methylase RsmD
MIQRSARWRVHMDGQRRLNAGAFRNRLYFGDNLEWLPKITADSVDLVYLDPPFNSNANYSELFRSPVARHAVCWAASKSANS